MLVQISLIAVRHGVGPELVRDLLECHVPLEVFGFRTLLDRLSVQLPTWEPHLMAANDTNSVTTATQVVTTAAPATASPQLQTPVAVSQQPTAAATSAIEQRGVGVEGEKVVWVGRYSMKNFVGRLTMMGLLTIGWLVLAMYAAPWQRSRMTTPLAIAGIVVVVLWLLLARRIAFAYFGHKYQLTNRRLFVSTGVFNRRRDQIELLRVQDVYTKQGLAQRWLSVGTVVVVSTEPHFPTAYLTGVNDPKGIMDLVWHHARAERDVRSVKVDEI